MTTQTQSYRYLWKRTEFYMPEKSGQYRVKWNNNDESVMQYMNGWLCISEIQKLQGLTSERYIVAWKEIDY